MRCQASQATSVALRRNQPARGRSGPVIGGDVIDAVDVLEAVDIDKA